MDDLGVRAELGWAVDDTVIKARTYRQDHVGVVHGHVGREAAMHAEHADKLTVGARVGTQAHQRIGHWHIEHFCQFGQWRRATAQNNPAACIKHRALGRQQHLGRLADLA